MSNDTTQYTVLTNLTVGVKGERKIFERGEVIDVAELGLSEENVADLVAGPTPTLKAGKWQLEAKEIVDEEPRDNEPDAPTVTGETDAPEVDYDGNPVDGNNVTDDEVNQV